jgi:hypothetical protein
MADAASFRRTARARARTDANVAMPELRADDCSTASPSRTPRSAGSRASSATTSRRLLKRNSGNISTRPARREIDRKYFRKLMKKYEIEAMGAVGADDDED